MKRCQFSLEHYADLLETAARRYCVSLFGSFEEKSLNSKPLLFLRHDIDHSLHDAVIMARLEAEKKVTSTYFVQVSCPFYSVTEPATKTILKEITGLGHEVGFHYSIGDYLMDGRFNVKMFIRDLELVGDMSGCEVCSVARHDPAAGGGSENLVFEHMGLRNAYTAPFFGQEMNYLSDSNCSWRRGCWCKYIDEPVDSQVLIHPVYWVNEGQDARDKLISSMDNHLARLKGLYVDTADYYEACLADRKNRDQVFLDRQQNANEKR